MKTTNADLPITAKSTKQKKIENKSTQLHSNLMKPFGLHACWSTVKFFKFLAFERNTTTAFQQHSRNFLEWKVHCFPWLYFDSVFATFIYIFLDPKHSRKTVQLLISVFQVKTKIYAAITITLTINEVEFVFSLYNLIRNNNCCSCFSMFRCNNRMACESLAAPLTEAASATSQSDIKYIHTHNAN